MAKITAQLLYDHISDHSSHLSVEENTTPVRSRNCTQRAAASKVNIEPGRCFPLGQQSAAAVDNNRYHDTAADSRHELQQQGFGGHAWVSQCWFDHRSPPAQPAPPARGGGGLGRGRLHPPAQHHHRQAAGRADCLPAGGVPRSPGRHTRGQYCLLPSSGLYCHTCRSPPARDC